MKYLVRIFTAAVLLITATSDLTAQGVSSSGTDYWLGFMPNGDQSLGGMVPQMRLFIASETQNKVSVSIGNATTSYSLVPNEIKDIPLDGRAMTSQSETVTSGSAVHVTSTSPITMYGYSVWTCASCIGGSPDGFLALPVTSYGTKYYDRAGNDTIYQLFYNGAISLTPSCDLGTVEVGNDSCMQVTLKNVQASSDVLVDSIGIEGIARGGYFTVSPTRISWLHPDSSVTLNICYYPTDSGIVSNDSLVVYTPCAIYRFPLFGIGTKPFIPPKQSVEVMSSDSGIASTIFVQPYQPNPIPLSSSLNEQDFTIIDVRGSEVAAGRSTHGSMQLPGLRPGLYFLRLSDSGQAIRILARPN